MTRVHRPASKSAWHKLAASLATLGCWLFAGSAWAQTTVDLDVGATTVEVGQPFNVQMQALSSEGAPESPRLKTPPDFSVEGPNVGSNHQVSFINGQVQRRTGISATWQLTAKRAGVYTLGPASVQSTDGAMKSRSVSIKVVPAGTLPQRRARRGGSPFDDDDFFGGLGGFGRRRSLLDEMLGGGAEEAPPAPPANFAVDVAPDPRGFVRAVITPQSVVVGQQVTLDVIAYGSLGRFRENNPHEPRRSDFYSYSLIENSTREPTYVMKIGGTDFYAIRIRSFALFPLKAGELEIGPMELSLYGSGYVTRKAQDGLVRRTNALTVHVTEPDAASRPLGYQLGDVGDYKLDVNVAPRKVNEGESISVSATVQGLGNVPGHLLTPEQKGVTWLEPTVKGESKQVSEGVVGGTRTFTYVVKLERAGNIELGDLMLPHWNPTSGSYALARASLGQIQVSPKPAASNTTETETARTPLTAALTPIAQLGSAARVQQPLPQRPWFWWLVLGAPLGVVLAQSLQHVGRGLLARVKSDRVSLARQCREAMLEARTLTKQGEIKNALSAVERALYLAIEDRTGLRARSLLQTELGAKLRAASIPQELCDEVTATFAELDVIRFAARAGGAEELVSRVEGLLKRMAQKSGTQS